MAAKRRRTSAWRWRHEVAQAQLWWERHGPCPGPRRVVLGVGRDRGGVGLQVGVPSLLVAVDGHRAAVQQLQALRVLTPGAAGLPVIPRGRLRVGGAASWRQEASSFPGPQPGCRGRRVSSTAAHEQGQGTRSPTRVMGCRHCRQRLVVARWRRCVLVSLGRSGLQKARVQHDSRQYRLQHIGHGVRHLPCQRPTHHGRPNLAIVTVVVDWPCRRRIHSRDFLGKWGGRGAFHCRRALCPQSPQHPRQQYVSHRHRLGVSQRPRRPVQC